MKRELIEISNDEKEFQTIELGRVVNYDQLQELFVDRSPLHSDTETESESDQPELSKDESEPDDPPQTLFIGTMSRTTDPEPSTLTYQNTSREELPDDPQGTIPERSGDNVLHGTMEEISQKDLAVLRQELEISDEECWTDLEVLIKR